MRLLQLGQSETDRAVLSDARLRELYYAILKGEAGVFARRAFGAGNAVARAISHVAAHLDAPISIDDMAKRAGMSRAVFHRKFKKVTTMSPIQFVKSMRLNNAAMKIAGGSTVGEAAMGVGYVSASQFSREFKRMYGQSPANGATHSRWPPGWRRGEPTAPSGALLIPLYGVSRQNRPAASLARSVRLSI
ncbi:helix-turn-helix domain-containing protein [Sulfitobacter profundi]|uniref:Helix-turn-helix domain-containing protein n=1 Tax=Sulfitobacter profundi TaxID=2679961 RepID=A0ABW1YVL3_9RHOB